MFEKLVESILEEYVSEWVVGLDAEKMKVALFGGKVEFRELQLKTAALDKFQLPLTVKSGTIGRLALKVPWKRLMKEAVTIRIEDVYLFVVPAHEEEQQQQQRRQQQAPATSTTSGVQSTTKSPTDSDAIDDDDDSYALRMRWAKQQEVRVRELLEKTKSDDAGAATGGTSSSSSSDSDATASWGYREKILHNIMDNVSFEFVNLHIRYEDTTRLLTRNPLALGVTIDAITVSTTNANGHVTFIDRAQSHTPFVHKLLAVVRAGVYCDDTSSVANFVASRRRVPPAAAYILHPFNTSVTMTMNHDDATAYSIPKLQFVADIGSINASVTPDQCSDLMSVLDFVSTHEMYLKRLHCRRKRPRVPVQRHAKWWWQYALFGVQIMHALPSRRVVAAGSSAAAALVRARSSKPRCDWTLFGLLWRYQHEYIRLHKRMLRAAAKKLAVESVLAERCRLNELEDVLDVDSIVFFRLCAAQELELEETRHDSTKKHGNWKARWAARTHSSSSSDKSSSSAADAAAGLRALEPLEKLALYSSISEQMHASSQALSAKANANKNAQTIRFAVDVAIASVRVSLVEHAVYDSASTTDSTRAFLQFELQQFAFALFQRTRASSITASIASVHMLDFSQVAGSSSGERPAQPLFYSLAAAVHHTSAASSEPHARKQMSTNDALPPPQRQRFIDLKIESTETKFALTCSFEPFRYIHNLSVAAKLQTYFVAQVDVSPALKENAEDALAYSSEWLNNAVFADPTPTVAAHTQAPTTHSRSASASAIVPAATASARVVELHIQLPEVDVLVLTTDTSPILQARLLRLDFRSGNLRDTFVFSLDAVSMLFYDGLYDSESDGDRAERSGGSSSALDAVAVSSSRGDGGAKLGQLHHQDALKDVRASGGSATTLRPIVRQSDFDLTKRTHAAILKKTRLMFYGEKVVELNRAPRWAMKCTAPPIYFTLSSAQYRQVLQASASWKNSTADLEVEAAAACARDSDDINAVASDNSSNDDVVAAAAKLQRRTSSFAVREFDSSDERFGLCVVIPQILVVLEGEVDDRHAPGSTTRTTSSDDQQPATATESNSSSSSDAHNALAIDLVLDVRHVNVEAKFASAAQRTTIDVLSFAIFKRPKPVSTSGKYEKVSTAEAIAQVNEATCASAKHTGPNDDAADVREPEPVYDPVTGEPTCKLFEVGPRASIAIVSTDPFRAKIRAQQVVLYWDQDLLVALFRSYLLGNSATNNQRMPCHPSEAAMDHDPSTSTAPAPAAPRASSTSAASADVVGRFGIDVRIERWYVFCRPQRTHSRSFALRLHGRSLFGDISTLRAPYLVVKIHAKNGATLESSRLVTAPDDCAHASSPLLSPSTTAASVSCDDVCELLSLTEPLTVTVESGGNSVLAHRAGAATYVHMHGAGVELNYVSAHVAVFGHYVQHQLVSFFNWVSVQTQHHSMGSGSDGGIVVLSQRTKIDAELTNVKVLLPRGAIGNPLARQRKPERMEMDVQRVTITSRAHPDCPRMEQLRIELNGIHVSTCMIATELRGHADAVASIDDAAAASESKAQRVALERALSASKTRMFSHHALYIEYAALPIVEDERKRQRRLKREAIERAAAAAAATTDGNNFKLFKDMDDVARAMEKLCDHVQISLHKPLDWDLLSSSSHKLVAGGAAAVMTTASSVAKRSVTIETEQPIATAAAAKPRHAAIDLALDLQQLELFGCILNENFAEMELLPRAKAASAAVDDEFQSLDVQIAIGDVNVSMLACNSLDDYHRKTARSPEERAIAQVALQDVAVSILGYSTARAQYRVAASHASLANVDVSLDAHNIERKASGATSSVASSPRAKNTPRRVLTSCAEMYSPPSASESTTSQCIDITIDRHEPPPSPDSTAPPQDIRVHVETCALTPAIAHFASRVAPFLTRKTALPFYTPSPSGPVNVSVTTGVVHCMLAKHYPLDDADNAVATAMRAARARSASAALVDDRIALHLILSGCFVVRYTNADANLQHVQLFGRKLSVEIASQWPPSQGAQDGDAAHATEPASSPAASPTSSRMSPTLRRISTATRNFVSAPDALALSDYRRVLCDDFALDMDMIDTLASESVLKVSASLTHIHVVLCTFDLFMLSQIAAFDFVDPHQLKPQTRGAGDRSTDDPSASASASAVDVTTTSPPRSAGRKTEFIINMLLEDASVTFVREIGEYFTPVMRVYTLCAMCKVRVEVPHKALTLSNVSSATVADSTTTAAAADSTQSPPQLPPADVASNIVEVTLHFSEENESELRDDEGMSVWGFNTLLGAWEPIVEPWTFTLCVTLLDDHAGKYVTSIDLSGSNVHALSMNVSSSLLDSLCVIANELEQLMSDTRTAVCVPTASVISCGFYLANDCGAEISYWVSDAGTAAHTSRGFSYAPRQKRVPELLLPRHKVPLKLSTALFHALAADQTVSFSWGNDAWHPLTDVRIHSAGKYVYSVLPKASVGAGATPAATTAPPLLALFDISSEFGYRTLTVSSLVRVFNDTDVAVDCGILADDGRSVIDVGTIEPRDACGIPITLVKAIASVRVVVKPHESNTLERASPATAAAVTLGNHTTDVKHHRWSNELFISEREDCTEHYASCSLILGDYDCRCQRMFDGSQPLHVSQICRANGSFFRVWSRVFAASNASSLRYAQLRVLPPLAFENKCGVPLFVVAFVFKRVRRAGAGAAVGCTGSAHDREYFHLVASEKIPPRSSRQFLASSLHESTYCAVSITGFNWSKLFLLPTVFPQSTAAGVSSSSNSSSSGAASDATRASGSAAGSSSSANTATRAGMMFSTTSTPSSPSAAASANAGDVLCSLLDFRARQATINVAFVSASRDLNAMRKVVIQPRYMLHNDTPLALQFEPRAKAKTTMSNAKAFFSLPSASKKPTASCCGSPQLELLHAKLNALNGATTTPSSPTARSTVFKRSYSGATAAASAATASPIASSTSGAFASAQEEMEYYYCSETSYVAIQLEGNAAAASGVQQFRLDAAMGGANSSLRVFDESKRLWYDLVAILEQIDSYTTKVTFVERYLVLNRTPHALMCVPACDIGASSSRGQPSVKAQGSSPSAQAPAGTGGVTLATVDAATLQPSATTAFNWCVRTTIPSDACVRLRIQTNSDSNTAAGWRWSGKVSLHEVSETALKLSNKYTNQVFVLRVEVHVESSVRVYVVLTSEDAALFPLYRIINSSNSEVIDIQQSFDGGSGDLSEHSAASASELSRGMMQRLRPGESLCFGWDEAYFLQSLDRVLAITYATSEVPPSKVLLDQPGEAHRVAIPAMKGRAARQVYLHWYLNGVTKTMHVHDTKLPRDKLTGKQNAPPLATASHVDARLSSGSGSGMLQLAATRVSELNLAVRLPSVLVSVLNSTPEEVLLLSAAQFEFAYAKTMHEHDQCELKIQSFQLDNQLENAVFPVIFTPVPSNTFSTISFLDSPRHKERPMTPPTLQERKRSNADSDTAASSTTTDKRDVDVDADDTFFHVSVFRLSYGDDVEYIKYLSAMFQPARLQIDDYLIVSAASLFTDLMQVILQHYPSQTLGTDCDVRLGHSEAGDSAIASGSRHHDASFPRLHRGSTSSIDSAVAPAASTSASAADASIAKIPPNERRVYVETLQLHPMKIHITFQQNNLRSATYFDDQATLLLPIVYMILKTNLVNIDAAALTLNALHIDHAFTTRAFMASTIQQHYAFQGVLQMYALVGAADILGNPIGLVKNLGTGVKDFFYEPVAGMVKSPQEFVFGLSRGTASLVKNSVYGTFNAASKFTGTLSSGIAALSMDASYINERNTRNRHEVPTHLGTGLLYGTKQLGQGILAGVSGVLTAPAIGAYNHGLAGFVEGVGKGLIGVAVKPTAGILDLAARTTAGITATATVFDKKARNTRVRLPRMLHTSDKRLRVYSRDEALVAQLLHRLPTRLLQNEHYEAHVLLPLSRALVVTSHQLLHIDYSAHGPAASVASVARAPLTAISTGATPRITWKWPLASVWGAQKTPRGVSVLIGTATAVQVSPAMATLVTKSSMSTVLIPLRDATTESAIADRIVQCITDVVAFQRQQRASSSTEAETYAAPLPRNSIGLVLEPVRESERHRLAGLGSNGAASSACSGAGQVVDVFVGSACFRAGIEVGDIVVGFGGKLLEHGDHGSALRYQLSLMKKGEMLELMVLRNSTVQTIRVATE